MATFIFSCSQCNNQIQAEEEWRGQKVICPYCNTEIIVPGGSRPNSKPKKEMSIKAVVAIGMGVAVLILAAFALFIFMSTPMTGVNQTATQYLAKIENTEMHSAGSAEDVRLLLNKGIDANARDDDWNTPLHFAKNAEVAQALLEMGKNVDVNARNDEEQTPLHLAKDAGVVKVLLEKGADPALRCEKRKTALHDVNSADAARLLIRRGADVNARDRDGRPPLHFAKNVEIARVLLESGAKLTLKGDNDETALHDVNSAEIARLLIRLGADVNAREKYGTTPLHKAKDVEIAKVLLQNGAKPAQRDNSGDTPLHSASNAEIIRLLIDSGADVNARNKDGKTGKYRNVEITGVTYRGIQITHSLGGCGITDADLNEQEKALLAEELKEFREKKEIFQAEQEKKRIANEQLRQQREEIRKLEQEKLAAEQKRLAAEREKLAAELGELKKITLDQFIELVKSGEAAKIKTILSVRKELAGMKVDDKYGMSALYYVCDMATAKVLIENGASVTARDKGDFTPLHIVIHSDNPELIEYLIKNGADVNAKDETGGTSLHYAAHGKQEKALACLLKNGARVNETDKNGMTPLDFAKNSSTRSILASHGGKSSGKKVKEAPSVVKISVPEGKTVREVLADEGYYGSIGDALEAYLSRAIDKGQIRKAAASYELWPIKWFDDLKGGRDCVIHCEYVTEGGLVMVGYLGFNVWALRAEINGKKAVIYGGLIEFRGTQSYAELRRERQAANAMGSLFGGAPVNYPQVQPETVQR